VSDLAARGEVGDRPLRDDLAAIDDRRGVAGLFDLVQQVRGDEHRAPLLLDHRPDHLAELLDAPRVKAIGGLVEDQEQRIGQQAARHAEPLAHAHRVALDPVFGPVGQPHPRERGIDQRAHLGTADRRDEAQVLATGEEGVEAGLLDDRPDALQRLGALGGNGMARAGACCRRSRGSARAASG
jgi:hypothetical protein